MSPRISYWTGWLDPQMVAVSKEVFQLMRHFRGSCAFGLSHHYIVKASYQHRCLGLHPRLYQLARPLIGFLERRFDISHVYTGLADWHFLNALGRRPIVLTVTQNGEPGDRELLNGVSRVVAETEQLAESALRCGVDREKVTIIRPGVDLDLFQPAPVPAGPWKCLFASSPENEEEIHNKGVDLLLQLARARPELQITMLWRPFGKPSMRALETTRRANLPNVKILAGRVEDIQEQYRAHHFTIAPFRTIGKPCPNSILEGLACGRPALVSSFVHIGSLLERNTAGIVFAPQLEDLVSATDSLLSNYEQYQASSRHCAESYFDLAKTIDAYGHLYHQLCAGFSD